MKKSINKILVFTLVISLLLPMFIFVGEVKAEEDTGPVGTPWITVIDETPSYWYRVGGENKAEIKPIGIDGGVLYYEDQYSTHDGGSHWNHVHGLVSIPLSSIGGTYTVKDLEPSLMVDTFNISGGKRGGLVSRYTGLRIGKKLYGRKRPESSLWSSTFIKNKYAYAVSDPGMYIVPLSITHGKIIQNVLPSQGLERVFYDSRIRYAYMKDRNTFITELRGTGGEDAIAYKDDGKWERLEGTSTTVRYQKEGNIYKPYLITPIFSDSIHQILYDEIDDIVYTFVNFYDSPTIKIKLYRYTSKGERISTVKNLNDKDTPVGVNNKHKYLIFTVSETGKIGISRTELDGTQKVTYFSVPNTSGGIDVKFISDDYIYYIYDKKFYRQHIEYTGINELVFNFVPEWFYTLDDDEFYYMHKDEELIIYKYSINEPPVLTLSDPKNSTESSNFYSREGPTTIQVKGTITDRNNDTVTVSASIGGVTKTVSVENTKIAKNYTIDFDVVNDNIPDGAHQLKVIAIDQKGAKSNEISRNIIVKARVKHNAFVLVDSPLIYSTEYTDDENDPKLLGSDQYRYIHDPNYFKNSIGLLTDNNTWRNGLYNKLSLPGHYKITYRAKDNPKDNAAFEEFRMQSDESLSEINLYVHRKPIAVFQATMNTSGKITINSDKSYDLDHLGETNNGIISREWRWKEVNSPTWTMGSSPPNSLPAGKEYVIGLRVRDKDGIGGIGVWGDWTDITLGTESGNPAPLNALYTLSPNSVSHKISETITVTNMSSGPITRYEWTIKKAGVQQGSLITTNVPTSAQLKAFGIGKYSLSLRVGDATRWSSPYELPYEVINHPPEASFEAPDLVYRDTNIVLNNTTPADKDGDEVNYKWKLKQPSGTEYDISTSKSPTFNIQSFINSKNIEPINAISNRWEIKLIAADSLGASSTYSRDLEVINHKPTSSITGSGEVGQFTTHTYTSGGNDNDTADRTTLVYRWNIIKPSGELADVIGGKTIDIYFDEVGIYKIEHWVIDQIGDESTKATKIVNVVENEPPKMRIVNLSNRRSIPASITSDPFPIEWEYTDKENDYQEKYSLDFYYYDVDILEEIEEDEYIETIQEDDILNNTFSGDIYEYLVNKNRFEMFRPIKIKGRVFSNNNWSEFSNDAYFIINNSPTNDFSLNKTRFVREEAIKVTGWGNDTDIINGDNLTFDYYYRKKGSSEWVELYYIHTSDEALSPSNDYRHSFEFNINSLAANKKEEIYEIRQVVTDSLGTNGHEKIREVVIENRKATVEITEPNSADKNNPSGLADLDLRPTIEWKYEDLDGDVQKKYRVYIYQGDTNTVVMDSGEKNGLVSTFKSPLALVEETLYSVIVEVYDGHEWSSSARKFFKVFSLKLENLKITGVYDIAWRDLFVGANNLSTGYAISVPINQITPLSRHPSKPSTPIKLGYKVEFEIDAKGLVDSADKVDTSIRFLDVNGNDVSSQVKYINDNGQNIAITNKYKSAVATVVSRNGVNSVWKFSYFMPATTQVGNLNDLIVETTIKATKSSNNITYNYNEKTGWNGRLFQYTLKTNALNDYYIQGGN